MEVCRPPSLISEVLPLGSPVRPPSPSRPPSCLGVSGASQMSPPKRRERTAANGEPRLHREAEPIHAHRRCAATQGRSSPPLLLSSSPSFSLPLAHRLQ
ncbi:hypothetical protein EYF80_058254 [Liparis tanakae]|uniref:Uncharacterized protein n=1 Tax=Liparis tanakae TaxID=230148 RepID=A0A4Z2ERQ6_9TELE|nr:hypothetical protein EYF80_058254 [Liparis tanakae]